VGFRDHLLVVVSGFGPTCQLILILGSLLMLVDGLAGGPEVGRGSAWFYGLAVLGALGVVANLVQMTSVLTEAGIPPASVGVGTLTEFYAYTVSSSLVPAVLAVVPLYMGPGWSAYGSQRSVGGLCRVRNRRRLKQRAKRG
jgi:hypothetical protein